MQIKEKTYKRELAVIMLLALYAFAGYIVIGANAELQVKVLDIIAPLTFAFAALAFGMQWFSTQYSKRSYERENEEGDIKG